MSDDSVSTGIPEQDFQEGELEQSTEKETPWTGAHERLVKNWGEHASVYRLLHARSHERYRKFSTATAVPIIVLSTVVGTLSIGSQSLFKEDHQTEAGVAVGILSLISSVLGTLSSYLKFAERSEGHKNAEVQYSKLSRHIAAELAMARDQRTSVQAFLKMCRRDTDALLETSPLIDQSIILEYKRSVGKRIMEKVSHPELIIGPQSIRVYCEEEDDRAPSTAPSSADPPATPSLPLPTLGTMVSP